MSTTGWERCCDAGLAEWAIACWGLWHLVVAWCWCHGHHKDGYRSPERCSCMASDDACQSRCAMPQLVLNEELCSPLAACTGLQRTLPWFVLAYMVPQAFHMKASKAFCVVTPTSCTDVFCVPHKGLPAISHRGLSDISHGRRSHALHGGPKPRPRAHLTSQVWPWGVWWRCRPGGRWAIRGRWELLPGEAPSLWQCRCCRRSRRRGCSRLLPKHRYNCTMPSCTRRGTPYVLSMTSLQPQGPPPYFL